MQLSYQNLFKSPYRQVIKLAEWLYRRGDITEELPRDESLSSRVKVMEAIIKASNV